MPKISVILPNFNHSRFLRDRIESVLNQTFQDFELIMLDDASVDHSADIIRSYESHPKVSHIVINKENSGSTFIQWEKGLKLAKGEYIWFAESDDLSDPDFLRCFMDAFDQHPEVGVVYTPSIWIDEDGKEIHRPDHESEGFTQPGIEVIKSEFTKGCLIYNASTVIFKKALTINVNFKELTKFRYTGDWFFWTKLLEQTSLTRLDQRLNYYRRHNNNVSFKSEREGLQFAEGLKVVNYILEHYPPGFFARQKIILYWALKISQSDLPDKNNFYKYLPGEGRFWSLFAPLLKLYFK